jgi:hypothetical protein
MKRVHKEGTIQELFRAAPSLVSKFEDVVDEIGTSKAQVYRALMKLVCEDNAVFKKVRRQALEASEK